jgi:hypothetical protein
MPTIIVAAAIAGGIAGTVGATVIAGTLVIGFSVAAFATTLVIGGLSMALAKDPQSQSGATASAQGRLITLRQPISFWQIIYGRRRVPGVLTFMEVTNGEIITLTPTLNGFEKVIDNFNLVQTNRYLQLVITWAGHPCEAIEQIWFDDEIAWTSAGGLQGRYAGRWTNENGNVHLDDTGPLLEVYNSLGAEAAEVQPFPTLVSRSGSWTNEHRQSGRTKTYLQLGFDQNVYPNGVPNVTAVIKGMNNVFDPRTSTRGYTANDALCIANYLENAKFGMAVNLLSEVNLDQLEAAANDCADQIPLAAGGTEDRYALNAQIIASEQPVDVLERFANAMAGRVVQVGDTWHIFAGVYEAPTVELGEGDLAGDVRLQNLISMRDNANGVRGEFTDPASNWQPTDFPGVRSQTFLDQDSGIERWRELKLATTVTSGAQSQRLAKIELLRTRQPITFSAPFKLSALRVITAGTVALTLPRYGWAQKPFEVLQFSFAVADTGELQVMIGLREIAANVYDWQTSEEQAIDPAPNTNLPDPFTVGVPGATQFTESKYQTSEGAGVKVQLLVFWAPAADALVDLYQVRYRRASQTEEDRNYTVLAPTPNLFEVILDVEPDVYVFAVRAINLYRVRSAWISTTREVIGLADVPEDITGLSIQAAGGSALLRWDLHPALDVREGGGILFRHSEANAELATWEQSFSIGERIQGNANQATLPLKQGTYLARAIDQLGILSANATKVETKQASVLNFVDIDLAQEDPSFPGTHSNTVATDALLKLAGTGLIDAAPDFDTIANFDSLGGIAGAGTYLFAGGIDHGSVQNVRLTTQLEGIIVNVNDLIDARTANVDDWADWDGTAGASADAYVEVQETDDNPASSPAWSAWKRLDSAEFSARAFQFRAQLLTADPAYNVHVTKLRVKAAQVY